MQANQCIHLAATTIFLWEWLTSLSEEMPIYLRLRYKNIRACYPAVVYFLARVLTMSYLVLVLQINFSNFGCNAGIFWLASWLYTIATGASAGLFFIRIRALYAYDTFITFLFAILWAALMVGCFATSLTMDGLSDGPSPSEQCYSVVVGSAIRSLGAMGSLFFDTGLFFAVVWRLLYGFVPMRDWIKAIFTARGLSGITQRLMQSGIQYYLISLLTNIAVLCFNSAGDPLSFNNLSIPPSVAIATLMACRTVRMDRGNGSTVIPSDGHENVTDFPTMTWHARTVPMVQNVLASTDTSL